MSFTTTATSLFSPAPLRGLAGMLHGWIPQDNSAMAPRHPQAPSSISQTPISRKRKRDAPSAQQGTPSQPTKASSVESRQYGMRKRAAKSYAEIDSDDELINESDSGSDSEYDTAPRKKPKKAKKTKPLPKHLIFPFLRLPRELRDIIYTYALTDPIGGVYVEERTHRYRRGPARIPAGPQNYLANYSHWTANSAEQAMPPWPQVEGYGLPDPDAQPHTANLTPALLAVCRQIRDEATPVLYAQPLLFEDAAALHAFLAPLSPATRGELREITILGCRGSWRRSMRAAFDVAALTLLAEGAVENLKVLRFHDEMWRENDCAKMPARRFYRRAFRWLEAAARARGVDEAVGVVQFIGGCNEVSTRDDHNEWIDAFWVELRKLVVKGLRHRR
ncbi:Formylmethionine deformylase-like protein [Lasiodiplodia theobromae]|uniref:Formylmethionine deformylase-like protein n=1 Tax=Lasiodiplodia theobromae TaxID=45133 RepID=UPI0015C35994|nr:Formylmethionine deformylase-like protein [Lasiodiplodia theobromae]KAF4536061.1 Formylmethionine deformylase-like protein [Lasiodiplodia theobromae]